ncbi:MAG: hypothetical protein AB201_03255 [Parcubacteria bacterium C7867-006]|nr:MAG: hypothetical protein AB201_03255 [Parcubacteria bacterium C7867-006]
MQPDEKALLRRTVELEEENNSMLRSIQRSMRLARFMSILYWVFIIGSAVGAYYLIQPYIDGITGAYTGTKDTVNSNLNSVLDTFKDLSL